MILRAPTENEICQLAPKRHSSFLRTQESMPFSPPPPPRLDTRFRGYNGTQNRAFGIHPELHFKRGLRRVHASNFG